VEYYSYTEEVKLEHDRPDHSPRSGLAGNIFSPAILATGESGTTYNLARGFGMPRKQTVINLGAFRGSDDVDQRAELVIPYSDLPVAERFWVEYDGDALVYATPSLRIVTRAEGYDWEDAGGRIQVHVERLGNPCAFWVPPQPGYEQGFVDRNHLGKVTGTFDGESIEGLFVADHLYSKPELRFHELELCRFDNYWIGWLVEFEDGTREGGFAWRGRPETGIAFAHHYVDGVSRARADARIAVTRAAGGGIDTATLTLGSDVTVELEQHGAFDWPFHTYGAVKSISRDRPVAKSWSYLENWPYGFEHIEHYQEAYQQLYGRYPSMTKLLEGARIDGEALVLAQR
jgi:hypothetical protein